MILSHIDPSDLPENARHYDFEQPVPPPSIERLPEHLRNMPVGASCWIEERQVRALRMHGRKRGWKLRYQMADEGAGHLASKSNGNPKHGRIWRIA